MKRDNACAALATVFCLVPGILTPCGVYRIPHVPDMRLDSEMYETYNKYSMAYWRNRR